MSESVRKLLLAGAGLALLTLDKVKVVTDELIRRGELTEQEAREAFEEIRQEGEAKIESAVQSILARLKIPTRQELEELKERVNRLEQALNDKI